MMILKLISESRNQLGGRAIAHQLNGLDMNLSKRAIRYSSLACANWCN